MFERIRQRLAGREPEPEPGDRDETPGGNPGGQFGPDPSDAEAREIKGRGQEPPRSRQQAERRRGRNNEPDHEIDRDI